MTTSALARLIAGVDRSEVQREADELREQLADCEALLRLIDRHGTVPDAEPAAESESNGQDRAPTHTNGNGHKRLSEKRAAVLEIMRERPGRWTNADLRAALAERGIDPKAGTPVKNIMWQLAKNGTVHGSGGGIYEFPALNVSTDDPRVQGAVGL